MNSLESIYGYHSWSDLIWWPLFFICMMGTLDRWIDSDKDRLPQVLRIAYLSFAIAAPLFMLFVLVLAERKYGWSHVGLALLSVVFGTAAFRLSLLTLGAVIAIAFRTAGEPRAHLFRWFKKFPSPLLSILIVPVIAYALLMMYYSQS